MSFNSKTDSSSETQKQAFNEAKDRNGIPKSQQPDKTTKVDDRNNPGQTCTQYDYTSSSNEKVSIRKDNPVDYKDSNPQGNQGPHYNAGETGEKLKQHHDYQRENK